MFSTLGDGAGYELLVVIRKAVGLNDSDYQLFCGHAKAFGFLLQIVEQYYRHFNGDTSGAFLRFDQGLKNMLRVIKSP